MKPVSYPLPGRLWIVRLAEMVSSRIRSDVNVWPASEKDRLGDQLIRAIDSVGANISEGYVRIHVKERLHFYSMAQGSLEETLFHLRRARDQSLITRLEAFTVSELLLKLNRAIMAFKECTTSIR